MLGGLLLVDLAGEAPDPADHLGDLLEHLEHYRTPGLRSAGKIDYEVEANWKGIVENYNECLHCPGVHPELNALSNYMSGEEIYGAGCLVRRLDDPDRRRRGHDGRRTAATSDRPPIDGLSRARICARSSTSRSSPTRWSRSTPTT